MAEEPGWTGPQTGAGAWPRAACALPGLPALCEQ